MDLKKPDFCMNKSALIWTSNFSECPLHNTNVTRKTKMKLRNMKVNRAVGEIDDSNNSGDGNDNTRCSFGDDVLLVGVVVNRL